MNDNKTEKRRMITKEKNQNEFEIINTKLDKARGKKLFGLDDIK